MTRNIYFFVLTVCLIIGISLFFSCTKVDSDDIPPTIEVLEPFENDTLFIYTDTDTILPLFRAYFTDDTALSSYTFRIRHGKDSISKGPVNNDGDTTGYFYKNYQRASIFGQKQDSVKQIFQIDSLVTVTNKNGGSKSYPIWEGIYQLDASVLDMQGNVKTLDPINVVIVKTKYKKE